MIVTGKVIGIDVTDSESTYDQGFGGHWSGSYCSGGVIHVRNGFGGQRDIVPKRIYLVVQVENRTVDVRVDSDFRYVLGNLSPKRTQAIIDSVPDEVSLYENVNRKGEQFYCLTEGSFNEWLRNTGL